MKILSTNSIITKIKCQFCNKEADFLGRSYDVPLGDSSKEEAHRNNIDKIMLILCQEREGVLGGYKSDKYST